MERFKANIKRIDIENFNLCNRHCETCPQSLGIRHKELEILDESLYFKLLSELAECSYSETLAIGRYHEPLLHFDLTLERIRSARNHLPLMRIIMNTNGDYLTQDRLKLLSESGLNEVKIMQYQANEYSSQRAEYLCTQMSMRLGKGIVRINSVNGEICYMQLENEGDLAVSVRSENYCSIRGNYRGGLLHNLKTSMRLNPCFVPQKSIDIDYNGDVVPCCNMISDSPLHKPYIIGNIRNDTIFDLYWKSLHSEFYEAITQGMFKEHHVCQFCTYEF